MEDKTLFLIVLIIIATITGYFVFIQNGSKNTEQAKKAIQEKQDRELTQTSTPEESPSKQTTDEPKPKSNIINDKKPMTIQEKLTVAKPDMVIDTSKDYIVTLKTTDGDIVIKMYTKEKPITVNNFIYLAKIGFYDNVTFHRVIESFMIQSGDPLGNGTGGPAYKFEDELSSPNENKAGTIAMANSGPDTNGSQFFINTVDNPFLNSKHTVFGEVISGMDVVHKIEKSKQTLDVLGNPSSKLETPVIIKSVTVEEK